MAVSMDLKHYSDICVICFDANPLYLFKPCLHKCICAICAKGYQEVDKDNFKRCPICRENYDAIEFDPSISIEQIQDEREKEEEELLLALKLSESEALREATLRAEQELEIQYVYDMSMIEYEVYCLRQEAQKSILNSAQPPAASTGAIPKAPEFCRDAGRAPIATGTSDLTERRPERTEDDESDQSDDEEINAPRFPSPMRNHLPNTQALTVILDEVINVYFRGNAKRQWEIKLLGSVLLHFPATIALVLANNPDQAYPRFRLRNVSRLDDITLNDTLCRKDCNEPIEDDTLVTVNLHELAELLPRLIRENPSSPFYSVSLLKYSVKNDDITNSCPLEILANWKIAKYHTDLVVQYKCNTTSLQNLQISVHIYGDFFRHYAVPRATRPLETNRLVWNLNDVSIEGDGWMYARFEFSKWSTRQRGTVEARFTCEDVTLSGVDIDLDDGRFPVKAITKRLQAGRYVCDGEDF